MRCEETHALLLPFQLGACEEPTRDQVERHLLECTGCLERYLSAKRQNESAAAFDERPSPDARAKVRASAIALGLRPRSRSARVGLVVGLAAAAALLVLFAMRWLFAPSPLEAPGAARGLVDSSPPSLDVF